MIFLKEPAEIRKAVHSLQCGKHLDIAVAFVGADWEDILSGYEGKLRVICWLSSTNTNPYAVAALRKRPLTEVKQRHMMHCKVYLAPNTGAVVGSANLSKAALAEDDNAGQDEAAIRISEPSILAVIETWFEAMWNEASTKAVKDSDIDAAIAAYEKARAARQQSGLVPNTRRGQDDPVVPPLPKKFKAAVLRYADEVRSLDLRGDLRRWINGVSSIRPEILTDAERVSLVDLIVSWTGHPGAYDRFREVPIKNVRQGLQLLYDESIDLQPRLEKILSDDLLAGLQMRTLSLLLYWKYPERYPPFNHRTSVFLDDLQMRARGMSAASPKCYATWLRWATRLHQRLSLPTAGHVDRLVERYYEQEHEA